MNWDELAAERSRRRKKKTPRHYGSAEGAAIAAWSVEEVRAVNRIVCTPAYANSVPDRPSLCIGGVVVLLDGEKASMCCGLAEQPP